MSNDILLSKTVAAEWFEDNYYDWDISAMIDELQDTAAFLGTILSDIDDSQVQEVMNSCTSVSFVVRKLKAFRDDVAGQMGVLPAKKNRKGGEK